MSVLNTLPAPVIQMGFVEKIVDQQQNQPHALLEAGQYAIREHLKAEGQRVAGAEASESGRKVRERSEGRGRGRGGEHGAQTAGRNAAAGDDAGQHGGPEQGASGNSDCRPAGDKLWAGHIVNMTI